MDEAAVPTLGKTALAQGLGNHRSSPSPRVEAGARCPKSSPTRRRPPKTTNRPGLLARTTS
eukprot:10995136-Alexandrium_andersonii.AAC.1